MKTQITIPKSKQHCNIEKIAFFGSAEVDDHSPTYQEAFKVARYLAYHDKIIVNGGGPGVMDASTQGAKAGGGKTISITFYPKDMPEFEGRYYRNIVDKEIKTATYVERMFGILHHADAFIVFKGGTGTLSEWATAWLLSHLYYGNHKPLILYGDFWHDVMKVITDNFFIGEKEQLLYKIVKDEKELIKALEEFELELADRCGLPTKAKISSAEPTTKGSARGTASKDLKNA